MPSGFTHALLPVACAAIALYPWQMTRRQWVTLLFLCAFLGNAPDLDLIPATLFPKYWNAIHREWGHNVFALVLWIWMGAGLLKRWVGGPLLGRNRWALSAALVLSHILLDGSGAWQPDHQHRPGVPLLWPLSSWEWTSPWEIYAPHFPVKAAHPLLGYIQSPEVWQILTHELVVFITVVSVWALAVGLVRKWKGTSEAPTEKVEPPSAEAA